MVGKTWWQSNLWQNVRLIISEYARDQINAGSQLVCLFFPFFQCRMVLPLSRHVFLITPLGMPHRHSQRPAHWCSGASYSSYADNQYCPSQTYPLSTWHSNTYFKSNLPLLTLMSHFLSLCRIHVLWVSAESFTSHMLLSNYFCLSLSRLLPQISRLLSCFCLCCCFVAHCI